MKTEYESNRRYLEFKCTQYFTVASFPKNKQPGINNI